MKDYFLFWGVSLLTTFLLSSCCSNIDPFGNEMGDVYAYQLYFQFFDQYGNNFVEDVELEDWWPSNKPSSEANSGSVLKDSYSLDIILSKQSDKWNNKTYNVYGRPGFEPDVNRPEFIWYNDKNGCYLQSDLGLYSGYCSTQDVLTYEVVFPSVFGDNEIHIITAYWNHFENKQNTTYYPRCYRVEFESQVVELDNSDAYNPLSNFVSLTVNRE